MYMGRASSEKSNAVRGQKNGRTFETIQQLSHRLTVFLIPDSNTAVTVHKFSIAGLEAMHGAWGENLSRLTMDGFLRKVAIECAQSFLDLERERAVDVDLLETSLFEDVERLGAGAPEVALDGGRRRSTFLTTSTRHKNFTSDFEPTQITLLFAMLRDLNPMSFLRASSRAETFKSTLNDLYGVTREASASCRILRSLYDVFEQARVAANLNDKNNDVVAQRIAAARSMSEGLREQTQALLSLQFSVAANQLENLMRMLTVFSTLFTPLGLLVSICGLNFLVMESFYGDERNLYGMLVLGACVLGLTRYWMKTSGVF
jgi:Mg2+ and Co2+ transporter CorA